MEQSNSLWALPLSLSVYVYVGWGVGDSADMCRCVGGERECGCLQVLERGGSIPWSWSYRWCELPNKSTGLGTELCS